MDINELNQRPWILLPGTLCTTDVFSAFLDTLGVAPELRFPITLDKPNVDDYRTQLENALRPGAIVCGFSLGAIVAAHYADRLEASAMLLFGLNPYPDDPSKREGRLSLEQNVIKQGAAEALTQQLPKLQGPMPASSRALILAMAASSAQNISAQTQLALTRPGVLTSLQDAQYPVFAITGTKDGASPLQLAKDAALSAPQGKLVALNDLGHYALIENPHACSSAFTKSLNSTTAK